MMLEQNGAESLLGKGDLLFRSAGQIVRLQALLLEEAEGAELFGDEGVKDQNQRRTNEGD